MWARQGDTSQATTSKKNPTTTKKSLLFPFPHPHSALHYITFKFLLLLLLLFFFFLFSFYLFFFSGTSLDTLAYSTASPGHVFSWSLTKRHQDFSSLNFNARQGKETKRKEKSTDRERRGKKTQTPHPKRVCFSIVKVTQWVSNQILSRTTVYH